jgi:Icc protein
VKVAWATDIHLNFPAISRVESFCEALRASDAEAVLLGGDIAEAASLVDWLTFLEARLDCPIFFVLGNHDYYGDDVSGVESRMRSLTSERLAFLPHAGVVALTERTALVGHGGWGDARYGDFLNSTVVLSDYLLIKDLRESAGLDQPLAALQDRAALQRKLQELGDQAAASLRPLLADAVARYEELLVLTHVPPFREACWHKGKIADDHWTPCFTCKSVGDTILEIAAAHPSCQITVLCGHTHSEGEASLLPNLTVQTQGSIYGEPRFRILTLR